MIDKDFPTVLGPVEFGKKAFWPSKLGIIDTVPPFKRLKLAI